MNLHPLLAQRWSPTRFDAESTITDETVALLLEAARWAPSAGNSQPWAFVVARRGTSDHARLSRHLAASSARWASSAGLLVANLSHQSVAGSDLAYSEFALYDLGQAVAHMTVQASSMGLHVRQFRAFDRDGVAAEFGVPPSWEVSTMSAIGEAASADGPPDQDAPTRDRRATEHLLWPAAAGADR